jgi:hypothetical protein
LGVTAREVLTYYAPYHEDDREVWEVACASFDSEYERIAKMHDEWHEELPHRIEDSYRYDLTEPKVSSETKKALTRTMKNTLWEKVPNVFIPPIINYGHFDCFGNSYKLLFLITRGGYKIQAGLVVRGKIHEKHIELDTKLMPDTDDIPRFLENILILADRYVDALSEAYGRVLDQTGTRAYLHPELI